MNIWLGVVLALILFALVIGVVAILSWFCITSFYLPLTRDSNGSGSSVLGYAIREFVRELSSGPFLIVSSFIYSVAQIVSTVRNNVSPLLILGLVSTPGFIWLAFHPEILKSYLTFTQCSMAPFVNNIVMPILNALRIIYNTLVQIWNWGVSIYSFFQLGAATTLLKCTASQLSFTKLLSYIGTFFSTLFDDFRSWIRGSPLTDNFDISLGIRAFQNIFILLLPPLDCFCRALNFLWVYLETLIGMSSVNATLNFAWITIINILQLPFGVFMSPDFRPDFTNVTLNSCGTVISAGEVIQEAIYLTAELLYGLITRSRQDLPPAIGAALSVRYSYIFTHPVCGAFRLVNMTLIAALNLKNITSPDGKGIGYFQFGEPIDELKVAAYQFGDFVDIIDTAIDDSLRNTGRAPSQGQALVASSLYALIDVLAFLCEWVPGNVFYLAFGGPLPASFGLFNVPTPTQGPANFWQYYFVDYWFKAIPFGTPMINPYDNSTITFPIKINGYTYSSAADSFFRNIWRASQALGDLVGLFNVVIGQAVRHLVNIIAAIVLFLVNLVSYSFCSVTTICSNMPITARNIDVDTFFNETYYLAGALGDLLRQFDNASCTSQVLDVNKTILCLSGEIIETALDVIILTVKEVVYFVQDGVALLSGQIKLCLFVTSGVSKATCLRIPDLTTAITELDDALCAFGYAVTALIPFSRALTCPFRVDPKDPTPKSCGRVQTCLGFEFCSILRFIPVILQIINSLFVKILSGTAYSGLETFLADSVGALVNQAAIVLEQFGLFLDCSLCAALGRQSGGCSSPVYNILHPIADAFRDLAKIFTGIFLTFVKMVILLIVGFFSGNPVTAIIDFIFAFLQNIFVGLGFALVNFIDKLLQKIGLGFLGSFIRILYTGFCTVLEVIINAVIGILKILSFNNFPYDYVQFCCSDGGCTPQMGARKRMEVPFIIGNVSYANMDNWLKTIIDANQTIWNGTDPCNASMREYSELPFTTLNTYQFGEVLFCSAKLIWAHRTDNQSAILPLTCDRMMTENMNTDWSTFSISDQGTIMECALNRMVVEGIRERFNISWFPQDIATNPLRKAYFGLGLAQGLLLNLQFFNDKTLQPSVLLGQSYRDFWAKMHVDVSRYDQLKTVEDVVRFKEDLRLRSYFDLNHATQYDATIFVATGLWSMTGALFNGLSNMSGSFSDNVTDAGLYLTYNYTLNNPTEAGVSTIFGLISQFMGTLTNLTTYWSDPVNYKKRSEAYEVMSDVTVTLYQESVRQYRLLASEYLRTKVYESTHLYNQTCASEEECRESEAFREQYEASMRGEDENEGATSLVFKLSRVWRNLDFTTYPIANPRYKHVQVRVPTPLFYKSEVDGSLQPETRWQRLTRYAALVTKGSRASQRRWVIATQLYERTRDKIYTQVLKHYYREEYTTSKDALVSSHHSYMWKQFEKEIGPSALATLRRPVGSAECHGEECMKRYSLERLATAYDENTFPRTHGVNEKDVQRMNPITTKGSEDLALAVYRASSFLDLPCIKNISFPCSYPLVCDANTTTLCNQCYYIQAFTDRIIAATDQTLTYYEPGGRYTKSLDKAYRFFDYSFTADAVVRVGDSPDLHVALFPSKSRDGSIWDFFVQSARYVGDDTPNKDRFDDFVQRVTDVIGKSTSGGVSMKESSLFTRLYMDTMNGQVLTVVAYVFGPVLQFFYSAYLYFTTTVTTEEKLLEYVVEKFGICDWQEGHDLDGTRKHFSIGELLTLYGVLGVAVNALAYAIFGFNPLAFIFADTLLAAIYISSFLTLYTNYAFLCAPAAPVNLADDVFDFIAYTVWPKGSWFWGFMFNSFYDNTNAASCEAMKVSEVTHCVHNEGFYDLSYNIAFMLDVFFPEFVNGIRSGTGIGRFIMSIPFLNNRINYFMDVDLDDPFVHSRYQGCNWITTLWWNLAVFILYLTLIGIFIGPIIGFLATVVQWLWGLATQLAIIITIIMDEVSTNPYMSAQMYDDGSFSGGSDGGGGDDDEEEDDDDDNDSRVSSSYPVRNINTRFPQRGTSAAPQVYRREQNGFKLSRLFNLASFVKDNLTMSDRKRR